MTNIDIPLHLVEIAIISYLTFSTIYIFIFSIASLFYKAPVLVPTKDYTRKYAIIIPAYKEDEVIIKSITNNLKVNYPKALRDFYIIADTFQPQTLQILSQLDVTVIEVNFTKRNKAKSLNYAIQTIKKQYDVGLILDADNILNPNFIIEIDSFFNAGNVAVQGHRVAKNSNTRVAILDGLSEEINNSIFRKGHVVLGCSSALIGSGMAFHWPTFASHFPKVSSIGEDKEFELILLQNKIRVAYCNTAILEDEKVANTKDMENQRSRWIAAQKEVLFRYFIPGITSLLEGNWDFFIKTIQQLLLPRIMLLAILFLLTTLYCIMFFCPALYHHFLLNAFVLLGLFSVLTFSLIITIPKKLLTKNLLQSILLIPKLSLSFFKSMSKAHNTKNNFNHTEHRV